MKKVLVINNNMNVGGIQKSLLNFLVGFNSDDIEINLLLFSCSGEYLSLIPPRIKVIHPNKVFRMLGLEKNELKRYPVLFIYKYFLLKIAKLFSKKIAFDILGIFQKKIKGYDCVISFSHLTKYNYFFNCSGEFALYKCSAPEKICYIHCDYKNSDTRSQYNDNLYSKFDKIVCCSESVKNVFVNELPDLKNNTFVVRNFYDLDIYKKAQNCDLPIDSRFVNIMSLARLTDVKGVDRGVMGVFKSGNSNIRYYIIGEGPEKEKIQNLINEYHLNDRVFMLGKRNDQYGILSRMDYLLVPSMSEAAPMVFDEAKCLGVSVISTRTTSAVEMLDLNSDIVCDNSIDGIADSLANLSKSNNSGKHIVEDNYSRQMQFEFLMGVDDGAN